MAHLLHKMGAVTPNRAVETFDPLQPVEHLAVDGLSARFPFVTKMRVFSARCAWWGSVGISRDRTRIFRFGLRDTRMETTSPRQPVGKPASGDPSESLRPADRDQLT